MKNALLTVLFVIIAFSIISIFYKRSHKSGDTSSTTELKFKNKLVNIGNIPVKGDASAKFIVYNIGKRDLIIKSVSPDCHCTASSFSKTVIKPRDSAEVTLRYDSSRPGVFQSAATVVTNTVPNTTILILRGNIE